ncbi:putative lipoprotein YajG [Roseovarius sp. MBR-51]
MMHARVAALAALALVAGCALPPQGVTQQDIALYDAAAASLGCSMVTEPDYLAAEIQTGLERQQLLDITAYKLSSGGAVRLPDGGVKLTTGACA